MSTFTTQAYLIHKQPQGDTSLFLYCLTRDKGLLTIHYRGGRVAKKRSSVESFIPLWCTIHERRGVYYLNTFEKHALPWSLNGIVLFSALYLNELLFYTLPHGEPEAVVYQAYETTLQQLSQAHDRSAIEAALRRFEIKLLKAVGYGLNWLHDDVHQPIHAGRVYRYQPAAGFIVSVDGFSGDDILAIANDRFDTKTQLLTAKRILRLAISHLLGGRPLASRDLLNCRVGKGAQATYPP